MGDQKQPVQKQRSSPVKAVQPKTVIQSSNGLHSLSVSNLLDFSTSGNSSNLTKTPTVKTEPRAETLTPKQSVANNSTIMNSQAMIIQNSPMLLQQRQPFSVQQIIAPNPVSSSVSSHHLIQSDPKFTGGLNFNQIQRQTQQQVTTQQQQQVAQHLQQQQFLQSSMMSSSAGANLSNDLNMIEPTLPFQPTDPQQQLFMRQPQVKHNM